MKNPGAEKVKEAVLEFLKTGKNLFGKTIFEDWFSKSENASGKLNHSQSFSEDQLQEKMKQQIDATLFSSNTSPDLDSTPPKKHGVTILYKVAASIAILIALSSITLYLNDQLNLFTNNTIANLEVREVPYGKKQKIKLSDGTEVTLNSGTEFRFPEKFSADTREVYLKGEAFFNVARDESKPFIIHSGEVNTTVLGTSFNVNAFPEEENIRVTVLSGKVKVSKSNGTDSVFLTPNQAALYNKSQKYLSEHQIEANAVALWKDNILNFNNQSLEEIATIMERWYDVKIEFDNDDLRNCYYAGKHENPNLHAVLRALCYTTNIKYTIDNKTLTLTGTCQ